MRMVVAAVVAMIISAAMADELDDAHRLAVAGRDSYGNAWPGSIRATATRACRGRISLPISRACALLKGRIFGLRRWITFRCNLQALMWEHL